MKRTTNEMRRAILRRLFEHLDEYYGTAWSKSTFVDGRLSTHQIDAILAFKSDARLNELRHALDRLDTGSYGRCISCKEEISQETLEHDPAQLVCSTCEQTFQHMGLDDYASSVHV